MYTKVTRRAHVIVSFHGGYNRFLTGTSLASEPGLAQPHGTRHKLEPVELWRFVSLSIIIFFG